MSRLTIKGVAVKTIIFDFDGTLAKLNINFLEMRRKIDELIALYNIDVSAMQKTHILETVYSAYGILRLESPGRGARFKKQAYRLIEEIELAAAANGELFVHTKCLLEKLLFYTISAGVITRNCRAAVYKIFPDILRYCPVVVCRDTVTYVKPHPEHLNKALEMTGGRAENSLMVGDHPLDIETGKNAGTITAGVLTGSYSRKDFVQAGADLVLTEAAQILQWIR